MRPTSHESLCQRWPPYLPAIGRLVAGFRRAKRHHLVRCSTLVSSPNVTMEQKLFSFLNPLQWIEASEVISKHKRISSRRSRYFFPAAERLQSERKIPRSIYEDARDAARALADTEAFEQSRRDRKRVEMLFAHLKRILRLGRLRLRGPRGAQDEYARRNRTELTTAR